MGGSNMVLDERALDAEPHYADKLEPPRIRPRQAPAETACYGTGLKLFLLRPFQFYWLELKVLAMTVIMLDTKFENQLGRNGLLGFICEEEQAHSRHIHTVAANR